MKFIDCPDCGGHGFITQLNENGQTSVLCMKCQGTGSIAVPMTNGDRIRAMSDEELARFLAAVEYRRAIDGGGALWCGTENAMEWLQQPVEGGDG